MIAILVLGLTVAITGADEKNKCEAREVRSADGCLVARLLTEGVVEVRVEGYEFVRRFFHCSPVAAVFSPDGNLLCSAGKPRAGVVTMRVWRIATGELLCRFRIEGESIANLSFSGDNRLLAGVVDRTALNLWEVPGGRRLWTHSARRPWSEVVFDEADGGLMAKEGATIRRFNANGRTAITATDEQGR